MLEEEQVSVHFTQRGSMDEVLLVSELAKTGSFATYAGQLFHYDKEQGYYKNITYDVPNMTIHSHISQQYAPYLDARTMNRIVRNLIAYPAITATFTPNSEFINVQNGVIDIARGTLLPHDQKYGFLYCRQFQYKAKAELAHAPQFEKYVASSIGCTLSDLTFTLLMEIIGYALSDRRDAKKAIFLYGESNTGKSILLHLLEAAFFQEEISSIGLHEFDSVFRFAELVESRINILHEITPARIKCVDTYKRIVSCEAVLAEKKGKIPVRKEPHTVLISATNMMPNFSMTELNDSLINRMLLLCFKGNISMEQLDRELPEKLIAEKDMIFSVAVGQYLKKLVENKMCFVEPEESEKFMNGYAKDTNSIRTFVEDCCNLSAECTIFSKTLYEAYGKYAKDNVLYQHDALTFGTIIRGLTGVHNKKIRIDQKSCRGYTGIGLKGL